MEKYHLCTTVHYYLCWYNNDPHVSTKTGRNHHRDGHDPYYQPHAGVVYSSIDKFDGKHYDDVQTACENTHHVTPVHQCEVTFFIVIINQWGETMENIY
jgi:hypothetical protein